MTMTHPLVAEGSAGGDVAHRPAAACRRFRYLICTVFDPETAHLLAERVMPALTAG
jgi:hypothetical protein